MGADKAGRQAGRQAQFQNNAELTGVDGPLLHGILCAIPIVEGDIGGNLSPQKVAIEPPVGEEHRSWCHRWRRGGGIGPVWSGARHGFENEAASEKYVRSMYVRSSRTGKLNQA